MITNLPNPNDLAAVRAWLAQHGPNVAAVRAWTRRQLAITSDIPDLGSRQWCALPDADPRKLVAAVRPALAHLAEREPSAISARLRADLDEFATAWRRAFVEASHDVSRARADLGYAVGPSHAELVRRRNSICCPRCRVALPHDVTRCSCGWRPLTADEIRANASYLAVWGDAA